MRLFAAQLSNIQPAETRFSSSANWLWLIAGSTLDSAMPYLLFAVGRKVLLSKAREERWPQ